MKSLSFSLIVFFIFLFQNSYSLDVVSTGTGVWDVSGTWSPDETPDESTSWTGNYITIQAGHVITMPGGDPANKTIDLRSSGILEIRLYGDLEFTANNILLLPSGAKIILYTGSVIFSGNSNGTLIEIGGNEIWGKGCTHPDCINTDLFGPGEMSEDSDPAHPLPVDLLYFNAKTIEDQVLLNWSTASELNNDYFTLEKSNNGKDFAKLREISGNGTTNLQMDYSYIDPSPYLGLSYYRLSQTDYDGTTEIFPVVSVLFVGKRNFTVGPNPVSGSSLKLKISEMEKYELLELNILDLQGRLVEKKPLKSDAFGNVQAEIQLRNPLKQGVYIFELVSGQSKEYIKVAAN